VNSHSNVSATLWHGHAAVRPGQIDYAAFFQHWVCAFGLIAADVLNFAVAAWLFRPNGANQEIAVFRDGAIQPVIFHANIYYVVTGIFIGLRCIGGDYGTRRLFWDGVKSTTVGLSIASLPDFVMALAAGSSAEWQLVGCWIFLVAGIPAARQCARAILAQAGYWKIPTAIIGSGPPVVDLHAALKQSLALGFDVRWAVVDRQDLMPSALPGASRIMIADPEEIVAFFRAAGCREAIIVAGEMNAAGVSQLVRKLQQSDIPVAMMPAIHRLPLGGGTSSYFFGRDVLVLRARSNVQRAPARLIKRLFDIAASALLLLVLAPLFLIIAATIKRRDPGPVTYAHTRVGMGGILFPCLKFRTMVTDAELQLAQWQANNPELHEQFLQSFKLKDDPRITPIGKWLRRTSLDELPQLLNVLRGEMSLVGPRPVVIQELEQYYGPAASLYLRVRPGLTGLWQVSGRNEIGYETRVLLDEWYILNWSFWNDLVILIQTVWIVLSGEGAL
jgi:undecaprenyl-phosphate galactose phosphotransferase